MPKGSQEAATLDEYHLFVVREMAKKMGRSRSQQIASMIEQWVVEHHAQVADAGATVKDFNLAKAVER